MLLLLFFRTVTWKFGWIEILAKHPSPQEAFFYQTMEVICKYWTILWWTVWTIPISNFRRITSLIAWLLLCDVQLYVCKITIATSVHYLNLLRNISINSKTCYRYKLLHDHDHFYFLFTLFSFSPVNKLVCCFFCALLITNSITFSTSYVLAFSIRTIELIISRRKGTALRFTRWWNCATLKFLIQSSCKLLWKFSTKYVTIISKMKFEMKNLTEDLKFKNLRY